MLNNISFSRQQQITDTLLLNSSFINNLGLMHGKMGIAIYFFNLAHETKNKVYEDYAGDLIDEIYDEITDQTPCDLENGFAGIGCGIEYLIRKGFIEAESEEVFHEFDKRLLDEITYHVPKDIGILKGISGYIVYFLFRIKNGSQKKNLTKRSLFKALRFLQEYIDQNDSYFIEEFNGLKKFDITCNYTSVLSVLAEMIHLDLYKKEAVQIVKRLLSPLKDNGFPPQLHSLRLLLVLSIEKLNQREYKNFSDLFLNEWSLLLISEIKREKICEELEINSAFLQHGAYGVSFIYQQLFQLTQNTFYNEESLYWKSYGAKLTESDQGYAGFYVANGHEKEAFGLLNGLSGIKFIDSNTLDLNIPFIS